MHIVNWLEVEILSFWQSGIHIYISYMYMICSFNLLHLYGKQIMSAKAQWSSWRKINGFLRYRQRSTRLSAYSTTLQELFKMERSNRSNEFASTKRWCALANPRHFFGPLERNWSPRGVEVSLRYRFICFGSCTRTNRSNRRQPAITIRICSSRSKDRTYIRPPWRHEQRESLSIERSEGNLVCVPASNRESKKIIGLAQGRNSASDLIHELGMKFLLLSLSDCRRKFGTSRSTSIDSRNCIDNRIKESDFL